MGFYMRGFAKEGLSALLAVSWILLGTSLFAADEVKVGGATDAGAQKGLRFDERFGRDESGNLSLLSKDRPDQKSTNTVTETSILSTLKDEDVFIDYGGGERITWGMLHGYVDKTFKEKISNLLNRPGVTSELGVKMYQGAISKVLQAYTRTQVVAREARALGYMVKPEEYQAELEKIRKMTPELAHDLFQLSFISNGLLQRAYVQNVLVPTIKVPDEAIAKLIAKRHAENLATPVTNQQIRAQMETIRTKLQNKELGFAEAAEEFSECTQCSSENGDCGTWYADDTEIDPILVKACFALPTNVLSQVIETPAAFHLVRVESRYDPDKKADPDEVSSAEVRHIRMDKWQLEEEYTPETARVWLEKRFMARKLKRYQFELIEKAPITCVVPLKASAEGGQRRVFK